jgi:hypothetical protein
MLELKEEKFRLSKRLDIPTDDIDDSLVVFTGKYG